MARHLAARCEQRACHERRLCGEIRAELHAAETHGRPPGARADPSPTRSVASRSGRSRRSVSSDDGRSARPRRPRHRVVSTPVCCRRGLARATRTHPWRVHGVVVVRTCRAGVRLEKGSSTMAAQLRRLQPGSPLLQPHRSSVAPLGVSIRAYALPSTGTIPPGSRAAARRGPRRARGVHRSHRGARARSRLRPGR